MLHSVVCICEYEYSHLHTTLCSARPCCRATPFKEKKSSSGGRKKAKPEKRPPHSPYLGGGLVGPVFYQELENLRIDKLYGLKRIERIIVGSSRESD